jgi:hypothetical protein
MPVRVSTRDIIVAAAIAVVAVVVRADPAFHYAFWQDEVASLRTIGEKAPVAMLRHVARGESTPPLWYALVWPWRQLGMGGETLRCFSVGCGAVLSAGVVLAARQFMRIWAAAAAGTLIALGWQPVTHGWELRSYELFALLCLAFVVILTKAAAKPTMAWLVTLALVEAAGTLTHYFFLFTLLAGALWLGLAADAAQETRRRLAVSLGAGLVPLVAWSPAAWHQLRAGRFSFIGPFDLRSVVFLYAKQFTRGLPHHAPWAAALLVVAVVLWGCLRLSRSTAGRLYALAAVVPVGAAAILWLVGENIFADRNLIGVAPFAALAVGAAVDAARGRLVIVIAVAVAVLAVATYVRDRDPAPPSYDRVASALVAQGWHGQPILLFGDLYAYLHPLSWYLPDGQKLAVGHFASGSCSVAFVVSVGGRADALVRRAATPVRIGGIRIGRVAWADDLPQQTARRGGHVLVAGTGLPCAEPG